MAEIAWGSAERHERTFRPKDRRYGRRKCPQKPCGRPCTHHGLANGVVLTEGCEWHMRRWANTGKAVAHAR